VPRSFWQSARFYGFGQLKDLLVVKNSRELAFESYISEASFLNLTVPSKEGVVAPVVTIPTG
jgi:hypothetical protein